MGGAIATNGAEPGGCGAYLRPSRVERRRASRCDRTRGSNARARRAAAAVKADIAANLHDLDRTLVPSPRHGVTPRYIHKLFENDGATFSQYVLGGAFSPRCTGL